ncbi:MAG: hypothetical protein GY679_03435 [Mycoplasma sp.]|nr:hypothetical protein [Mycoplasma sp.]
MLKNFKMNKTHPASNSLDILFNFIIITIVSLTFNGMILNSRQSTMHEKFFMLFNAGLVTVYWYVQTFLKQRFEKHNVFFKIITLMKVLSLGIIATALDLLIFRNNTSPGKEPLWIEKIGIIIWITGYIVSRLILLIEYTLCILSNKDNKTLVKITTPKAISRLVVILIGIIHLLLIIEGFDFAVTTYIFMPLYISIEFLGNVLFVTDKNLSNISKISISDASERYKKLTTLYIGSFFISGTIQFAYYLKNPSELHALFSLTMVYLIGFLMWWFYSEYSHHLDIKQNAVNLWKLSFSNIFTTWGITLFGASIINSHNDKNIEYILGSAPIGLMIVIIFMNLFLSSLKSPEKLTILNFKKQAWITGAFNSLVLISFSMVSIFRNDIFIPMWSLYVVSILVLLSTIWVSYISRWFYIRKQNKMKQNN